MQAKRVASSVVRVPVKLRSLDGAFLSDLQGHIRHAVGSTRKEEQQYVVNYRMLCSQVNEEIQIDVEG